MSIQHAVRSFDEIKDILFLGLDASIHLQTHDLPLGSVIWFLLWYGISRDMTLQIAEKLARVVLLLRPLVFLPGKAQVSYKSAAPSLFTSAVAAEGLCRISIARDKHWTRAIFAAFPQRWADGLRGLNSEGLLELTHAGARLYAGKAPPGIGACCYILCSRSHFYVGRTAVMRAARPVPGPVARCLEHMAMLIRPPASKKRASVYLLLSRSNIDHIWFFPVSWVAFDAMTALETALIRMLRPQCNVKSLSPLVTKPPARIRDPLAALLCHRQRPPKHVRRRQEILHGHPRRSASHGPT